MSNWQMDKQIIAHLYNRVALCKKEQTTDTRNNTAKSQDNDAK